MFCGLCTVLRKTSQGANKNTLSPWPVLCTLEALRRIRGKGKHHFSLTPQSRAKGIRGKMVFMYPVLPLNIFLTQGGRLTYKVQGSRLCLFLLVPACWLWPIMRRALMGQRPSSGRLLPVAGICCLPRIGEHVSGPFQHECRSLSNRRSVQNCSHCGYKSSTVPAYVSPSSTPVTVMRPFSYRS